MFIVCDGSDCPFVVETREEMENSIKESVSLYADWVRDTIVQERFENLADFKAFEDDLLQEDSSYLKIFEVMQAEIDVFNAYLKEIDENVQVSLSVESIERQDILWKFGFISWLGENSSYSRVNLIQKIHDEMPDLYKEALDDYIEWLEG